MKRPDYLVSLDSIENIIVHFNGSAHLKEIQSGKYMVSNHINAINLGYPDIESLIGLTIQDVDICMRKNWGNLAARIVKFDRLLQDEISGFIEDKQLSLLPDGFVAIHNMKKYPVKNRQNKVSWILTLSEQVTDKIDNQELFNFYLLLYKTDKKMAIRKFLSYYKIAHYFFELPTETEVKVLLNRTRVHTTKAIASRMSVSPKTIACHLDNLRVRLNCDMEKIRFSKLPMRIQFASNNKI